MDQIGKQLAQIGRHLAKYVHKTRSAMSPSEAEAIEKAIALTNVIIDAVVAASRARTAAHIQSVYDAADDADDVFVRARAVTANASIIRKATSGMTTADEVDLASVASACTGALDDYIDTDRRSGVIADTAHCTDDEIVSRFASDTKIGTWAATLIAHRKLRSRVDGAAIDRAKDTVLGFVKTGIPCRSPLRILPVMPLTEPKPLASLQLYDGSGNAVQPADPDNSTHPLGGLSFITIWHEYGSPVRFNFSALQIQNTAKGPFGGLTNDVLRRFETMIKTPASPPTGDQVAVITGGADATYILETYDGKVFSAWNGGHPCPNNVVSKYTDGDADRVSKYHSIMEEDIVTRMVDPMAASIVRQYGDAKVEYSGSQVTEAARDAVRARLYALKNTIRMRADFMKNISDRNANVAAMLAATERLTSHDSAEPSLRVILKRNSAAVNFAKMIERHSHTHAPSNAEFEKYENADTLVEIAVNSTLDAAFAEAKRVKTFADLDRTLADYVRAATQ